MRMFSHPKENHVIRRGLLVSLVQAAVRNQPKTILRRIRAGARSPKKSVGSESRRKLSKRTTRPYFIPMLNSLSGKPAGHLPRGDIGRFRQGKFGGMEAEPCGSPDYLTRRRVPSKRPLSWLFNRKSRVVRNE